jgi:hypothetical protein
LISRLEDVITNGDRIVVGVRTPGIDAFRIRQAQDRNYVVFTVRDGRVVAMRDCRDRDEALGDGWHRVTNLDSDDYRRRRRNGGTGAALFAGALLGYVPGDELGSYRRAQQNGVAYPPPRTVNARLTASARPIHSVASGLRLSRAQEASSAPEVDRWLVEVLVLWEAEKRSEQADRRPGRLHLQ